ncbi:MAG TPA: hypothetical protein V6C85_08555 [Allocoleopsis sp.]
MKGGVFQRWKATKMRSLLLDITAMAVNQSSDDFLSFIQSTPQLF